LGTIIIKSDPQYEIGNINLENYPSAGNHSAACVHVVDENFL
jgi:hypothetical protein